MRDKPSAADLLTVARKVLRDGLVAALPADRRYDALMVANAMAIAARQIEAGAGPERDELARLAALLGEDVPGAPGDDAVRAALTALYARLCASIRAGARDPGSPAAGETHAFLTAVTRLRVAESNPKYLETATP